MPYFVSPDKSTEAVRCALLAGEGRGEALELLTLTAWENPQILHAANTAGIALGIPDLVEPSLYDLQLKESLNVDPKLTQQIRIAYLVGLGELNAEGVALAIQAEPTLLEILGGVGALKKFPELQKKYATQWHDNFASWSQKAVLAYLVNAHHQNNHNPVGRLQVLRCSWTGYTGGGYNFGLNDDERAKLMESILNTLASTNLDLVEHSGFWRGVKAFPAWEPTPLAFDIVDVTAG